MSVIKNNHDLLQFCEKIKRKDFITVDTEFSRDKTYYPILCLLQISDGINIAAIDPLENIDMKPIWDIILDDKITKVFHSAKQDLEIIYNHTGKLPKNVFDTQLVASVCGYGDYISYSDLVKKILNTELDKTQRYTNWQNRPLTENQINYALADVTYLVELFNILKKELKRLNREEWIKEELNELINHSNYIIDEEEIWTKIKFQSKSKKFIYAIMQLAKWRELKAREINIPRTRVISDVVILDLALNRPKSTKDIANNAKLKAIPNIYCTEIFSIFDELDKLNKYDVTFPVRNKYKTGEEKSLSLLLKLLLKLKAIEYKVSERIIASSKTIETFSECSKDSPILNGWRYKIFGKDAQKLQEGKIAIRYMNDKIEIFPVQVSFNPKNMVWLRALFKR